MIRYLKTKKEKRTWLYRIVKANDYVGVSAPEWMDAFERLLCNRSVTWTILTLDQPIDLKWAEVYRRQYGKWDHCNGQTSAHNELGMAYAAWALAYGCLDEVILTDSPDIYGRLSNGSKVIGDIGKCTIVAFTINGIYDLDRGDLWISILDTSTQVIIEPSYSIVGFKILELSHRWGMATLDQVERVFKVDGEWMISDRNKSTLLKYYNIQGDTNNITHQLELPI